MKRSSRLLINEHPLQVLPSLAVAVGLNEALFLQQVHYWISRPDSQERDGRRWVYNSYPAWQRQFPFWSVATVRRTIEHLIALGLLITGNYNAAGMDRTLWYSLDYDALDALPSAEINTPSAQNEQTMIATCADQVRNLSAPIPETNTEINNREGDAAPPSAQLAYPANPASGTQGDMDRDWDAVGHATRNQQLPPGTPVNRRPDRPAVLAVPKPSDDPMTAARWATVKATWTADGTKITDPRECETLFAALPGEAQVQVVMGAAHYVAGRDRADGYGMSLRRFIEQGNYEQWQTPETPRLRVVKDAPTAPPPRRAPMPAAPDDAELTAIWNRPRTPRSVTA